MVHFFAHSWFFAVRAQAWAVLALGVLPGCVAGEPQDAPTAAALTTETATEPAETAALAFGRPTSDRTHAWPASFAYVADDGIRGFAIDAASGSWAPVPGSPVLTGGGDVTAMAVDRTHGILYAAIETSNIVHRFKINPDGSLAPVAAAPFAGAIAPWSIAVTPSGRFIYVSGDASTANFTGYELGSDGSLAPLPGVPMTAGDAPTGLVIDRAGGHIYAVNTLAGTTSAFSIDPADGHLTPIAGSPFTTGITPTAIALAPNGRFACVTDIANDGVFVYAVDPDSGALGDRLGPIAATGASPRALAFTPTGSFLYVGNTLADSLSGFRVNVSTGALAQTPGAPYASARTPRALAIDPTGRYLYATALKSQKIHGFSINPLGDLTELAGFPYDLPDVVAQSLVIAQVAR